MSYEIFTYSPSEIYLEVGGYRITGFKSITAIRTAKAFKMVKGIRGSATRVRNTDTSAIISVDIMQTSLANDVLSKLVEEDLRTNSVRLNVSLTDQLGSSKISSSNAFIDGYPRADFEADINFRTWNIVCLTTEQFKVGGNGTKVNSLFSSLGGAVASAESSLNSAISSASKLINGG